MGTDPWQLTDADLVALADALWLTPVRRPRTRGELEDDVKVALAGAVEVIKVSAYRAGQADAWDKGYASGRSNAMRYMSDEPNAPSTPNPYRLGDDRG